MRYVYLRAGDDGDDDGGRMIGNQMMSARRPMSSPRTVTTAGTQRRGPGVDDVDDDSEARQLYEWTRNLSVDD